MACGYWVGETGWCLAMEVVSWVAFCYGSVETGW